MYSIYTDTQVGQPRYAVTSSIPLRDTINGDKWLIPTSYCAQEMGGGGVGEHGGVQICEYRIIEA